MKKLKKKRERRRYGFSLLNKISYVLRNYFVYLIYYILLLDKCESHVRHSHMKSIFMREKGVIHWVC